MNASKLLVLGRKLLLLSVLLSFCHANMHAQVKPFIYTLDEPRPDLTLRFINPLLGWQSFYNDGFRGASSTIGNIEPGLVWPEHVVFTQTPSPSDRVKIFSSNSTEASNIFDAHATAVGHVLAGGAYLGRDPVTGKKLPYFTGMAPNATLVSGAVGVGNSIDGLEVAGTPQDYIVFSSFFKGNSGIGSLDVINSSFGSINDLKSDFAAKQINSLALDQLALQNPTVAFVVAAGNEGGQAEKIPELGSLFNNITVGSVGGSAFLNPSLFTTPGLADFYNPVTDTTISGARHAVDLAAPGELLLLADYAGSNMGKNLFNLADGTSFSSPFVAGGIALLKDMARTAPVINHIGNGDAFDTRVIKSVLMASATKTVGWNNGQNEMNITTQPLDLLTGAGRMNLDLARDVYFSGTRGLSGDGAGAIAEIGWDASSISLSQSLDYSFASAFSQQTSLTIALNWFIHHDFDLDLDSETPPIVTSSFSNLDLELWLLNDSGGFGQLVGASRSTYNNTELLHFDSLNPGKYGFKVNFPTMVYDSTNQFRREFYGLAWDTGYVGDTNSLYGSILINSKVTFSQNIDGLFNGTLSGNGKLIKEGGATLILDRNNTHAGGTLIKNGTLWVKNGGALGEGALTLEGKDAVLLISSVSEMGAHMQVAENFNWNNGRIGYYDTGDSPSRDDLMMNVAGNFTLSSPDYAIFDFSKVQNLSSETYALFSVNGSIEAASNKFLAWHGDYTKLVGNFTIVDSKVFYAVATDPKKRYIINNAGTNISSNQCYEVKGATSTVGQINSLRALVFTNSSPLEIQKDGQLVLTSGTVAVLNGESTVSGGMLRTSDKFTKTGSGGLNLQSNIIINGAAAVNEGLLSVNGNLAANNLVVNVGGALGGSGVVFSDVVVLGNLVPGNSPGTLTVAGNLSLASASATVLEIANPTTFDSILVGGTATLGGTLQIVPYGANSFAYGQQYAFLQAGSITGNFSTITAPDTFRGRFLNGGTVGAILIAPDTYMRVAVTPNQRQAAKALDNFIVATDGDRLAVSIALDSLTTEQFPAAFDQIMPGFYESLANMAIEQAFNQTQMLNQRIRSMGLGAEGFQAIGGITQPLLHDKNGKSAAEAKDASPIVESATATNWNAWALGTGMFSRTTNLGSLQNYNNDAGGFLVGSDYRWSENFVTGLYAGYDYSYAEYNGGGSTKGNSFSFGTYASYEKDGYYADAVIGGGYTGFQTKRSVKFSTIDRTASADPNSGQFTAGLNLGKDFEVGKFTLGPIVGAQYTYAGIGSFTESGAESLDLSLGQQNANSLRSTLGGRVAYTWNLNQKIALIPEVRMFWQHEFLNNPRNINASLDGGNGASFGYETTDPYRNSVFAGAGVTAQFGKNLSGSVFYNINFGSQTYQNNMVSAGLNFSF